MQGRFWHISGADPLPMREVPAHRQLTLRCPAATALMPIGIGLLLLAYAVIWSASSVLLRGKSDLDLFFWPAAQTAASGHPLQIYSTNTMGAGPYANGPLGLLPLVPIAALARAGGWAANVGLRTFVVNAVCTVFSLLMAITAIALIRRGRGAIEWRTATFAVFLLAPTLWISVASSGHLEQPIELAIVLWAVVLGLRGSWGLAGAALGLALLTRTTALLYLIPFALLPLAGASRRGIARALGTTLVVGLCGLLPFGISDGVHLIHSLVGYRGDEAIGGGSLWLLAIGTPGESVVQHVDTYLALAATAFVCGAILVRRPATAASASGFCGLLTIAAVLFPMLAKTAYPYYFLEPYVFATVWWLGRPGSALNWRIAMPALLTLTAVLVQRSQSLPQTGSGVVVGVTSSALLAGIVVAIAIDLTRQSSAASAALRSESSFVDVRAPRRPLSRSAPQTR